jgi:hypothetical protein
LSVVSQSRGNESVEYVVLYPYGFDYQDDDLWDKVGHAVGKLQALKRLLLTRSNLGDDGGGVVGPIPDWEILARVLKHVRQRITLHIANGLSWNTEGPRLFARAIQGHTCLDL